ncbi:MAG: EamA family transporter [Thermodesulfobacteriota bacterium]|nr:EamA family transporter [Thermodesulfobacteriota bacterium]
MNSDRLLAICEGLLVTIIWASSFVFIKMGLTYWKPLTLAGMRYYIAFLLLLPLMVHHGELKNNSAKGQLIPLFLMGLCAYTIGNGTLFWGLKYLPATTGSFLHSLVSLPVLFLGIFWLKEIPRRWQIIGPYDQLFKGHGKTHVPGFGMTPGTTDMMVKYAADQMETVEIVRISHGAFRPIAFSASITETTTYEYDPNLPGRVVYEDGKFIQVPPFARPREIELPEPYGTHSQYIIPHAETKTVAQYLAGKGIRLIEVRGTWPPKNMELIKVLYEWGFMRNDKVKVGSVEVGIMDAIGNYLMKAPEGQTTELYGYALHVEVIGTRDGKKVQHILTHTHPASDGSVKDWEKLRAYTRCVGIPMAIGAQMIASGKVNEKGVVIPEFAFDPQEVFRELEKRQIFIHEKIQVL